MYIYEFLNVVNFVDVFKLVSEATNGMRSITLLLISGAFTHIV